MIYYIILKPNILMAEFFINQIAILSLFKVVVVNEAILKNQYLSLEIRLNN